MHKGCERLAHRSHRSGRAYTGGNATGGHTGNRISVVFLEPLEQVDEGGEHLLAESEAVGRHGQVLVAYFRARQIGQHELSGQLNARHQRVAKT